MAKKIAVYLDCAATTPMEEQVVTELLHYCMKEYGNAGSHTHLYGSSAARAVKKARDQVAAVVGASADEVIFTSGATESNNLAILGLADKASERGKRHIISTHIEHKSVLEPLQELVRRGFEVTLLPIESGGVLDARILRGALRPDTFLVSVMHVNNELGTIQPLHEICDAMADHPATFHTDAAQGFGKELGDLRSNRIDLISASAHKVFGPKGVGALIVRSGERTSSLRPLMFGGGQERGLRPGTVPVHLVVGFGVAAELAVRNNAERRAACSSFRHSLMGALEPLRPALHGDADRTVPHVLNVGFGEIDSEAVMIALKGLVAISNGSACTSSSYEPSHVLKALGLPDPQANAATRWSWCHLTPNPDWEAVTDRIRGLI